MTVMRLRARPSVVALLLVASALAGGCASDDDAAPAGADVTTESTSADAAPSDAPWATDPAVAAVCEPFARMVTAIEDVALAEGDRDKVAASIAPVMKEFAGLVPELRRPPGMPPSSWRAVRALAERILALPDRPTYDEIAAVDGQGSACVTDGVEAPVGWFRTRCAFP